MKKLLMTLMAAMLPLFAFAGDWIEMLSSNGVTHYIYDTVENVGDNHHAWIKMTYDTPAARQSAKEQYGMDEEVYAVKFLCVYNEDWTMFTNNAATLYGKEDKVIDSYSYDDDSWEYVVVESKAETWRDFAQKMPVKEQPQDNATTEEAPSGDPEIYSLDGRTYCMWQPEKGDDGCQVMWMRVIHNTPEVRNEAMEALGMDEPVYGMAYQYAFKADWSAISTRTVTIYGNLLKELSTTAFDEDDWRQITPESNAAAWRDYARAHAAP